MIGSLRGVVQEVHPPFVLLEVAGVGYLVSVIIPTIATVSRRERGEVLYHL